MKEEAVRLATSVPTIFSMLLMSSKKYLTQSLILLRYSQLGYLNLFFYSYIKIRWIFKYSDILYTSLFLLESFLFQNVADSYFTNQRLDFINETLFKLAPEVKLLDPRRINFEPLKQEIDRLTQKAYVLKRQVEFHEEDGKKWKDLAEDDLKDMNNLEQDVIREINLVNTIINEVQSLASNTELGTGPKIDNALKEAQEILAKIKQVRFSFNSIIIVTGYLFIEILSILVYRK